MNRCPRCGFTADTYKCPRCGADMVPDNGYVPTVDDMMREGPQPRKRRPFLWQSGCFTAVVLFIFWPAGLVLMWVNRNYNLPVRIVISVLCLLMVAAAFLINRDTGSAAGTEI